MCGNKHARCPTLSIKCHIFIIIRPSLLVNNELITLGHVWKISLNYVGDQVRGFIKKKKKADSYTIPVHMSYRLRCNRAIFHLWPRTVKSIHPNLAHQHGRQSWALVHSCRTEHHMKLKKNKTPQECQPSQRFRGEFLQDWAGNRAFLQELSGWKQTN